MNLKSLIVIISCSISLNIFCQVCDNRYSIEIIKEKKKIKKINKDFNKMLKIPVELNETTEKTETFLISDNQIVLIIQSGSEDEISNLLRKLTYNTDTTFEIKESVQQLIIGLVSNIKFSDDALNLCYNKKFTNFEQYIKDQFDKFSDEVKLESLEYLSSSGNFSKGYYYFKRRILESKIDYNFYSEMESNLKNYVIFSNDSLKNDAIDFAYYIYENSDKILDNVEDLEKFYKDYFKRQLWYFLTENTGNRGIDLAKSTLKQNPFDVSALSFLVKKYPHQIQNDIINFIDNSGELVLSSTILEYLKHTRDAVVVNKVIKNLHYDSFSIVNGFNEFGILDLLDNIDQYLNKNSSRYKSIQQLLIFYKSDFSDWIQYFQSKGIIDNIQSISLNDKISNPDFIKSFFDENIYFRADILLENIVNINKLDNIYIQDTINYIAIFKKILPSFVKNENKLDIKQIEYIEENRVGYKVLVNLNDRSFLIHFFPLPEINGGCCAYVLERVIEQIGLNLNIKGKAKYLDRDFLFYGNEAKLQAIEEFQKLIYNY